MARGPHCGQYSIETGGCQERIKKEGVIWVCLWV